MCDDKGAQAVVANGARHSKHSHDAHAIPEQDLAASSLYTGLMGTTALPIRIPCGPTYKHDKRRVLQHHDASQYNLPVCNTTSILRIISYNQRIEEKASHRLILSGGFVVICQGNSNSTTAQHRPRITCAMRGHLSAERNQNTPARMTAWDLWMPNCISCTDNLAPGAHCINTDFSSRATAQGLIQQTGCTLDHDG